MADAPTSMRGLPTIDEAATTAAGGTVLPSGRGITIGGWTLEAYAGPIAGEAELSGLRADLATHHPGLGPPPTLPEQLFAASYFRATHAASGVRLEWTAAGAVAAWLAAGEPPLKVREAAAWRASREADIAATRAPTLAYDWTFTSPYAGDVRRVSGDGGGGQGRAAPPPSWAPAARQLDRGVLTARDPILLFADVPLLESELDDHGASLTGVRVRAMPGAWFALARCFVRVDGVAVRLAEARVLATWGDGTASTPRVVREVRVAAGTFDELRAGGAPGDGLAYADAECAADALAAVAPVGVKTFVTEELVVEGGEGA